MIPASALLDAYTLGQYERDGSDALTTGERVLMRLRWFDWIAAGELLDAMDVTDAQERVDYARALYYRVQVGQVVARGTGPSREYRLAVR